MNPVKWLLGAAGCVIISLACLGVFAISALAAGNTAAGSTAAGSGAAVAKPIAVDQGSNWTSQKRNRFYTLDQGSRIMPLSWIKALKLPDGKSFMHDGLRRYGYLRNDANPLGLSVGFSAAGPKGHEILGMTCAACHTRQIESGGKTYRIDGGPALVEFQVFVADLDSAVLKVLEDPAAYKAFIAAVLGAKAGPGDKDALRWAVNYWYLRHHTIMERSLPRVFRWGVGRVDAMGMIFNRFTGLDIGPVPTYIIAGNILRAAAPVRYPFLWNAHRQDRVQWTGFVDNTDGIGPLARNIGQVLGVFAEFQPKLTVDANGDKHFDPFAVNSINFKNLITLEDLMSDIGKPQWPWAIDAALAKRGGEIYKQHCENCHAASPTGKFWPTPITVENTDTRAALLQDRDADTGILADAGYSRREPAAKLLGMTAGGLAFLVKQNAAARKRISAGPSQTRALAYNQELIKNFRQQAAAAAATAPASTVPRERHGYVARVLHGIWAAAPYLHNGSVPTLADLLKPAEQRPASFAVGQNFDPIKVGLATKQTGLHSILTTTGCNNRNSGNSRCGHEYGTTLPDESKKALLEYLKQL